MPTAKQEKGHLPRGQSVREGSKLEVDLRRLVFPEDCSTEESKGGLGREMGSRGEGRATESRERLAGKG